MKISLKRLLLFISTGGITLSSAVILFLLNPSAVKAAPVGVPLRILIPKINVNAAVESVGLARDGSVGVPKNYANTAWFNIGVRPGEAGSAVIDGHYGWSKGRPLVFNNLAKLRPGDKIYVKDKTGGMVIFAVRELRTYDMKENAAAVFGASDGRAHLNLVTCEGIWNKATKSYSQRLVVFTDML